MAKLERTKAMTTIILSVYVGHSKHKNVCAAHDTRENKKKLFGTMCRVYTSYTEIHFCICGQFQSKAGKQKSALLIRPNYT